MIRFSFRFLVPVFAAIFVLSGCEEKSSEVGEEENSKPRFAFVTNGVADFWTIADAGANKAGEEFGAEVDVIQPVGGSTEQKAKVEDLMTRGVDGIAISPIDPVNQTDLLNKAAAVTNVITHDSDAPDSNRLVYIGMDNYYAGRMCGELVKEALPDGGKIMFFIGRMEQDNSKRRRQGVIDELMDRDPDPTRYDPPGEPVVGEKFTVLDTLTDNFDRKKAKDNAEDTLSRHPDVAGMVGLFAYNTPQILQALSGKKDASVKVIAFDEETDTLAGIESGDVYGTIVQNPYLYGYESIRVLAALEKGDQSVIPENKVIDIPARMIKKDNLEEFWTDLKAKTGKKVPPVELKAKEPASETKSKAEEQKEAKAAQSEELKG